MKGIGRPFLVMLLILILTAAGFLYYYLQTSAAIASANANAFVRSEQVSSLQVQLASADTRINAVQSQLTSANSLLASLQAQLAASNSQITSLQKDITANTAANKAAVASLQAEIDRYKTDISKLQGEIASYKTQIASLEARLVAAGAANITALQEQVASLRAQNQELTDITKLARSSMKADSIAINQEASHTYTIATFTADYAGYITISGITSYPDIYFTVTDSFAGYPYNEYRYPFTSGGSLVVPVLPGIVTVYYNNANPNVISTATITVKYYY